MRFRRLGLRSIAGESIRHFTPIAGSGPTHDRL
jgi:hypothetical protein